MSRNGVEKQVYSKRTPFKFPRNTGYRVISGFIYVSRRIAANFCDLSTPVSFQIVPILPFTEALNTQKLYNVEYPNF
jgi:hypothetical protein